MIWTHKFFLVLAHCEKKQTTSIDPRCYRDSERLQQIDFPNAITINGAKVTAQAVDKTEKGIYYIRVYGTSSLG